MNAIAPSVPDHAALDRWRAAACEFRELIGYDPAAAPAFRGSRTGRLAMALAEIEEWTGAILDAPPLPSRSDAARSLRRASPGPMDPTPAVRRHTPPEG